MPPSTPPHVKCVISKGRRYYYFDTGTVNQRGQPVYTRLPDINDKHKFGAAYASCNAGRTRRANAKSVITVERLATLFEDSPHFNDDLARGSQRVYRIYLRRFVKLMGKDAPASEIERHDIVLAMDSMVATKGAANLFLGTVGALYAWGRKRGHVSNEPTADVEPFDLDEHEPWPDDVLERALASQHERTRLAVHLLYYTAQRIGDAVHMKWADIRDGCIYVAQGKTGKELVIPIHPALQAELAKQPRRSLYILSSYEGRPMTHQVIRRELKAAADNQYVPHGLRKNAVNALLEAGCSEAETAAISGQSLGMVRHYAKKRNQKRLADSAVLKWQAKK